MILDNEQQRIMLIDIIESGTFVGKAIRPLSQLLHQIETATISEEELKMARIELTGNGD